MQYFNIQVASQLSGVASATIRAWEKRYKAIVPQRGENQHRLYSEEDIEKLSLLSKLTSAGQSIGKIAHLELSELQQMYSTVMRRPYEKVEMSSSFNNEEIDYDKILTSFFIALGAYKLDIISHELEKTKNLISPKDLCLKVLIPLFREIGFKVERNELTIAQEHALSAIFSFHIGQMIGLHYQKRNLKEGLILIATPEGEIHELGILSSALLCVHYGVKFIFLGANMPAASLSEAANALSPKAILIGTIVGHELTEQKSLGDYLLELKSKLKVNTQVMVGGNLRPYIQTELEKNQIPYFPTLEAFDQFLQSY